jgi:hypothetical protein
MQALASFAKSYRHGSFVPAPIWTHARVMSKYLSIVPPEKWLWDWLNRGEHARRPVRKAVRLRRLK